MKQLMRLITKGPAMYLYYMRISGSFDFMRRYTLLGITYLINALFAGKLWNQVLKTHKYFDKSFLFRTPFGIILARTVTQWSMLIPDYEPLVRSAIMNNINETPLDKRVAINIGSHIGRYAIELANMYSYRVHCFEPYPDTFRLLSINTILNDLGSKITLHSFALGNIDAEMDFEYIPHSDGSSRIIPSTISNSIKVPVRTFDNLGITDKPSLVIMDVEGFEYEVLQGMKGSLSGYKDISIIIEIFERSDHKIKTIEFMESLGYNYKMLDKDNHLFKK